VDSKTNDETRRSIPTENRTLQTEDSRKGRNVENDNIIAKHRENHKTDITSSLPPELASHLSKLDGIVQTGIDTLVTTNLSVLASLSGGTKVYDSRDDGTGTPIIIYSASFFKSGGGKTVSANVNRRYFLDWREKELEEAQKTIDMRRNRIEIELKSLGNSTKDRGRKARLEEELLGMETQPDVYLEDATSEGFEASIACGSTPFLFVDNFGKYLIASGRNEHKANMLRMLDNVFDSGRTTTRRLKGENQRARQLHIEGFGANFASTMGVSNLKPKDIMGHIENGFLNKVLITFQDTIDKPIPLKTSLSMEEEREIEHFTRKYHTMAKENDFYLDDDAYSVYKKFHQEISDEFVARYNNDEDLAGLIIRLLKISKRIACIFEIASQCLSYKHFDLYMDDDDEPVRHKHPISAANMRRSIGLLRYLQSEHIDKIMLYAQSDNGKLSREDIVLSAMMRLSRDKKTIDHRSIVSRLSKKQRMNVDELKPILENLMNQSKIGRNNDGTYYLRD